MILCQYNCEKSAIWMEIIFLLAKLTNGYILYNYKKSSGEVDAAIHSCRNFLKHEEYMKMQLPPWLSAILHTVKRCIIQIFMHVKK